MAADAAGSRDASSGRNRDKAANHQRQLRLMMRQCDRVLLADYDLLAMEKWPDNARISAARRRRDLWVQSPLEEAAEGKAGTDLKSVPS
jgi:hypothetical protein